MLKQYENSAGGWLKIDKAVLVHTDINVFSIQLVAEPSFGSRYEISHVRHCHKGSLRDAD